MGNARKQSTDTRLRSLPEHGPAPPHVHGRTSTARPGILSQLIGPYKWSEKKTPGTKQKRKYSPGKPKTGEGVCGEGVAAPMP